MIFNFGEHLCVCGEQIKWTDVVSEFYMQYQHGKKLQAAPRKCENQRPERAKKKAWNKND